MKTTIEMGLIFDTVLSSPGMTDSVKVDAKLSRKNVLLLSSVIQAGLAARNESGGLLENLPVEVAEELQKFSKECLEKAGLTELYEKLKAFTEK